VLKHFNCAAGTLSPPGSWLTREPLYKAPSGHPSVERNNTLHTDIPIPWLARTGPWESRSLRDILRIQSSPAQVKTGNHVFGECYQHDYSLLLLPVCDRIAALLEGVNTGTASFLQSGTTTPTSAMSTSAGMNAVGYNLLLTVYHMIYIFAYYGRSVFVMNIVSFASVMFVLLIFWIKLLVNLPKFPTD
jgi:hypothetical protein